MKDTWETLVNQSLPFPSGEGKVEENHLAHDIVDNGKTNRKNQAQQAAPKLCTANMPSENHQVVKMRLG